MEFKKISITPAKAQSLLDSSLGNRAISKVTVRSYRDSMLNGKWDEDNGQCIVLDKNGCLIDGHHRLHAIIEAQRPIVMHIAYGASDTAFATIDCGRHRTLSQLIGMQKVQNYNVVASIVAGNNALCRYGRLYVNNASAGVRSKEGKRTNADSYDEYSLNAAEYQDASNFACEMYTRSKVLKKSWTGSIYYYLTNMGGYEKQFVRRFFEQVCNTDGMAEPPAVELLRKRLIKESQSNKKTDAEIIFALIVKAWNCYVTGKHIGDLKLTAKEAYPEFILSV